MVTAYAGHVTCSRADRRRWHARARRAAGLVTCCDHGFMPCPWWINNGCEVHPRLPQRAQRVNNVDQARTQVCVSRYHGDVRCYRSVQQRAPAGARRARRAASSGEGCIRCCRPAAPLHHGPLPPWRAALRPYRRALPPRHTCTTPQRGALPPWPAAMLYRMPVAPRYRRCTPPRATGPLSYHRCTPCCRRCLPPYAKGTPQHRRALPPWHGALPPYRCCLPPYRSCLPPWPRGLLPWPVGAPTCRARVAYPMRADAL